MGIYRLSRYFSVFKSEIANGEKIDFQRIIDCYVFDKILRTHCMGILEVIEVFLKNLLVLIIDFNYINPDYYKEEYKEKRLAFITEKIEKLCENDKRIKKHFQVN